MLEMNDSPLISIVVPVYNAEEYMEACINSLTEQTYRNLEIVLVDDGSADRSLALCKSFAAKDPRLKVFHKKNEGPGSARNFGVLQISGEFFMFVDADDWLRKDAVELLYNKIAQENTDIVFFDFVAYNQQTKKEIRSYENGQYVNCTDFIREKLKRCTLPSTCTSLYRTQRWIDSGIRFSDCLYEDNEIYPKILIEFQNACILPEGLYYYRINSGQSITQRYTNNLRRTEPIIRFLDSVKNDQKYKSYYAELYHYCRNQFNDALHHLRMHVDDEQCCLAREAFNRVLDTYFPGYPNFGSPFLFFGSYNIGRIGNSVISHDIERDRYVFSGLSALMSTAKAGMNRSFENPYRELMLKKEQKQALLEEIAKPCPKYLVFDLLEERCPLVYTEDGGCYTGEGAVLDDSVFYKILTWTNETERMAVFRESCRRFAAYCRDYRDRTTFILIKTFLSEQYGTVSMKKPFPNAAGIRKMNQILSACYEQIEAEMQDLIVCDLQEEAGELLFTDESFYYGCRPEHLNNYIYSKIGSIIIDRILLKKSFDNDKSQTPD